MLGTSPSAAVILCPPLPGLGCTGQGQQCLSGLVKPLSITALVPFIPHPINAILLKSNPVFSLKVHARVQPERG